MKNEKLFLVILVSLFILTSIMSVKASTQCEQVLSVLTGSYRAECGDSYNANFEEIKLKAGAYDKMKLTVPTKTGGNLNIYAFYLNDNLGTELGKGFDRKLIINPNVPIYKNYQFILSTNKQSHLMELVYIDEMNQRVTLKDVGLGRSFTVNALNQNINGGQFDLDGNFYRLTANYNGNEIRFLSYGSDGNGVIYTPLGAKVKIYTEGGIGKLEFTDRLSQETITVEVASVGNYDSAKSGVRLITSNSISSDSSSFEMVRLLETQNHLVGYTSYGTYVDYEVTSTGQNPTTFKHPTSNNRLYDKRADFDNSKKIDFDDLMLLSTNYDDESWCNAQLQKTFDPCNPTIYECTETDNGKDYYTAGQTTGYNIDFTHQSTIPDVCSDSYTVRERFCGADGKVLTTHFTCPDGCFNGACVVGCIDRDGGQNYYIKGSITGFNSDYPESLKAVDTCYNSNTLKEHFCGKLNGIIDGSIETINVNCANGCSDGACIADCTDTDNGRNYYVKGEITGELVSGPGSPSADMCLNEIKLRELFCNSNSKGEPRLYECPNGCNDGACRCDIIDTLAEGKSKTYTVKGTDYNINAIVITDMYPYKVKFKVNGYNTDTMQVGDRFKLADGAELAVTKLNPAETTPDYVTFCLNGKQSEIEPMFENYPDFLIKDNKLDAITVIGNGAPAVDSIAATDILLGLRYYNDGQTMHTIDIPAAVLSSEVSNPRAQNMILIGRPTKYAGSESNPLIDDFSIPSLDYGEGLLKISDNGDYVALIVTARDKEGIIKVAQYLKNYNDHTAILKGTEVRINYETSEPTCTDSDSGRDYYKKGYTINENGVRDDDVCMSDPEGKILNEYYCEGNEGRGVEYVCPNGCKDGACIRDSNQFSPNSLRSDKISSISLLGVNYSIDNMAHLYITKGTEKNYAYGSRLIELDLENGESLIMGDDYTFSSDNSRKGYYEKYGLGAKPNHLSVTVASLIEKAINQELTVRIGTDQGLKYVFLPKLPVCNKHWRTFYISKDGSTYYSRSDHGCGYPNLSPEESIVSRHLARKANQFIEPECVKEGEKGSMFDGNPNNDVCCEGLVKVRDAYPHNTGCTISKSGFVCTKCGNRVCGLGENHCNCPEDCTVPGIPDYVDVEIEPDVRTINYGQYARYTIAVKDKHENICPVGSTCASQSYTYNIDVNNLPFLKEYKRQVTLSAGGKTSFTLTVKPYQLAAIEEEEVTTAAKVQKITANVVVGKGIIGRVVEEMVVEENPQLIQAYYAKRYKFNVRVTLSSDPGVYKKDYAELIIKPEIFIDPPDFPTEEITIKLYKGWNLISLPGKLVQFSDNGCTLNRKLLGFVYLKEVQKYVTLQEAQDILGNNFAEYLAKNAFWIYSYEDCSLRAKVDVKMSYSGINLYTGWNLIPITEDMVGGYLSDIMSECSVEKIYKWNPQIQNWKKITTDYIFLNTETYYGFITKVSNNCVLGGVSILELAEIQEVE